MATSYVMSEVPKFIAYPPNAVKRILHVYLIDEAHELQIALTDRNRLVIQARPGQFKYPALPGQR
jgi:hypothetical protein